MQTSRQFTATQQVSLESYQRLSETLIQQAYLFESVMTEDQFLPHLSQRPDSRRPEKPLSEKARSEQPLPTAAVAQRFVCMQSADLSVLLVATPLTGQPFSESYGPVSASQLNDLRSSERHLLTSQKSDLTQAAIAQAVASTVIPPAYQIQLSFNRQTISDFVRQLVPHASDREVPHSSSLPSSQRRNTSSPLPVPARTPNSMKWQTESSKNHSLKVEKHKKPKQESLDKETLKKENSKKEGPGKEDLVLAWTKRLAESPDGMTQDTLANQVEQSLLLNQVITRIRHSLDLPSILETTVAQVRDFLSADRLVVYQFDQVESVDFSSLSSTGSSSTDGIGGGIGGGISGPERLVDRATTDFDGNSRTVTGRRTHAGYITYESRVSEDIPSVLNWSEAECFGLTSSIRDRYIMGQPVAVDDVDQRYAHTPCLLDFLHCARIKSEIIAPIIVQNQVWGLLIAHQCDRTRHWQETEVLFLQHIAEHLAVAISQAELYKQLREQTVSLESCVVERTQNLHDALLAAESANLTKGEFLSTMSHELRTPLTYIIGMSATLLRWSFGELSDRQRSYLDTINHSGEQLLGIINDILEFAKISSGRSFLDISEFSLRSLVDAVVGQFQPTADKQGVQLLLSLEIDAHEDSFCADARRLQQILSNLVHNAIKFTPEGGSVTLHARREAQVSVFQVEDTGIGIPEAKKGLLFEKFKQLESPFQRQYSGTGLGLAMTKRLVELHGGTIHVKSQVGKGSTFCVRLPAQTSKSVSDRYQIPVTLSRESKRILLLESQENTAAIICDLLTADGYEVIWHIEAEAILTQIESLQPAMLIADLSLLGHDSGNLKKIQLAITAMDAKVLALIDKPSSESSHMAHHDTLSKPIEPKQLIEKVRYLTIFR